MNVARNTFAVFWSIPGRPRQQFHADLAKPLYPTPRAAVEGFRDMFPRDVVHSVRDGSGRFLAFKGA
jgi:hypothetical protein